MARSLEDIQADLSLVQQSIRQLQKKENSLVIELGQWIFNRNQMIKDGNVTGVLVIRGGKSLLTTAGDTCRTGKS